MRIDTELAATLAAVVDEGTMDAAARRLRITPSAVSQRIRALEDGVGQVLLIRSKPAAVTPAGSVVLRLARQLALLEHDAHESLGDMDGDEMTSVALAVNADSLATWFLEPLARVTARRRLTVDVHRDDQDYTAGLLESGTVTAAVTSRATPIAGCRVTPLGVMRYEAVATPAYIGRWLPGGIGDDAALANAPLVDFDRRDDLQARYLAGRGVTATPPRHYVPASADFAHAVELGLGWAMLPRVQSARAITAGELVLLGGDPVDVPLYWQQWNLRSALLDEIAAEIVAAARIVLAQPVARRRATGAVTASGARGRG